MFDSYTEIFLERAHAYHSAMLRSPRARDAEFQAVLEPLAGAPDGLVCDMPSGGCYLAPYLPPGMRYVGIEPVREFLDSRGATGGAAINAPITSVPLPGASVDYVVSLAGLHHEASLATVFGEMRRLVRPEGRVIVADVAADTPPARFLNGFVASNNPMGHDGRFLDARLGGVIEAAGLTVVADEPIDTPWVFDSFDEAGAYCAELFGLIGPEPQAVVDAMEAEIGFGRENSCIRLKWTLRRIVCQVS